MSETTQNGNILIAQKQVYLRPTESKICRMLLEKKGGVIDHKTFFSAVWGTEWVGDVSVLYAHICYLREKFRKAGSELKIKTIIGKGYKLV